MSEPCDIPILVETHLELQHVVKTNITPESFSMHNNKYLTITENTSLFDDDEYVATIIEICNPTNITRYPTWSSSVRMSPDDKIIAIKQICGHTTTIQIFNSDVAYAMKHLCIMDRIDPDLQLDKNQSQRLIDIIFWKWISNQIIVLITDQSVYHWDYTSGEGTPHKIFNINSKLRQNEIVDYSCDAEQKWLLLSTRSKEHNQTIGKMQLFSVRFKVSRIIDGFAGVLFTYKMHRNLQPSTLISYATRTTQASKLVIFELGDTPSGNLPFQRKMVSIFFPPAEDADYPLAIETSLKHTVIYVITKQGYVHLYDIETGTHIYMHRISTDDIIKTQFAPDAHGALYFVDSKWRLISVTIDDATICDYIMQTLEEPIIAIRLSRKLNFFGFNCVHGGTTKTRKLFLEHIQNGRYADAVAFAKSSNLKPDYLKILRYTLFNDGDKAVMFATIILAASDLEVNIDDITKTFQEANREDECAQFLINALKFS